MTTREDREAAAKITDALAGRLAWETETKIEMEIAESFAAHREAAVAAERTRTQALANQWRERADAMDASVGRTRSADVLRECADTLDGKP